MEIDLYAKSSTGEPYTVTFHLAKRYGLTVACGCPAGLRGQLCKHKLGLIGGDEAFIDKEYYVEICEENAWQHTMKKVRGWISQTTLAQDLTDFHSRLAALEKEQERIKKEVKVQKAALARKLREGVA